MQLAYPAQAPSRPVAQAPPCSELTLVPAPPRQFQNLLRPCSRLKLPPAARAVELSPAVASYLELSLAPSLAGHSTHHHLLAATGGGTCVRTQTTAAPSGQNINTTSSRIPAAVLPLLFCFLPILSFPSKPFCILCKTQSLEDPWVIRSSLDSHDTSSYEQPAGRFRRTLPVTRS